MSVRKSAQTRQIETLPVRKFTWERLLFASSLPSTTKLVAFGLLVHADDTKGGGLICPGVPRLAAGLSITERSVSTHLEKLHEHGFVDIIELGKGNQHGKRHTRFQLTIPKNMRAWLHGEFAAGIPSKDHNAEAAELSAWVDGR